jgi:hypothetical protein
MRCIACNSELTDYEATRKSSATGEFLDLCNTCYNSITEDVQAIDNKDLITFQDYIDISEDL